MTNSALLPIQKCVAKTRILLICGILLLLSGCTLRLAYQFLDWGLLWKLQHYLSLTSEQRSFAKKSIADFHVWHRQAQLPAYVDYISHLQQRIPLGNLTASELHAESDRIQLLLDVSVDQLLPAITDLFATLSDRQIEGLTKTLEEDREDYYKDYVKPSPQELHKKLVIDLKKYLEPHIGKMTKEQNLWLQEWSHQLLPFGDVVVLQQQIWANKLTQTLAHRDDKVKLKTALRELLLYRTDNWEPKARQLARANQQMTLALIAKILNNLSEKQRKTLADNLATYRQDCLMLIAENHP